MFGTSGGESPPMGASSLGLDLGPGVLPTSFYSQQGSMSPGTDDAFAGGLPGLNSMGLQQGGGRLGVIGQLAQPPSATAGHADAPLNLGSLGSIGGATPAYWHPAASPHEDPNDDAGGGDVSGSFLTGSGNDGIRKSVLNFLYGP
jgi:hypothetical protein